MLRYIIDASVFDGRKDKILMKHYYTSKNTQKGGVVVGAQACSLENSESTASCSINVSGE